MLDNHKIIQVLNHNIGYEENTYKNIYTISVQKGFIRLEGREYESPYAFIPTIYKIPIHSFKAIYRGYKKQAGVNNG